MEDLVKKRRPWKGKIVTQNKGKSILSSRMFDYTYTIHVYTIHLILLKLVEKQADLSIWEQLLFLDHKQCGYLL